MRDPITAFGYLLLAIFRRPPPAVAPVAPQVPDGAPPATDIADAMVALRFELEELLIARRGDG